MALLITLRVLKNCLIFRCDRPAIVATRANFFIRSAVLAVSLGAQSVMAKERAEKVDGLERQNCDRGVFKRRIRQQFLLAMESSNSKAYRLIGHTAVGFSVVAILSVCVTLPLVYQQAVHVRQQMHGELRVCRSQAEEVLMAVDRLPTRSNRTARQAGYDTGAVESIPEVKEEGTCEGCCLPGVTGPPGAPGRPGTPGRPGAPGHPGNPGKPPQTPCEPITPPPCQPCPAGEPGAPGEQGPSGAPGKPGEPGKTGPDGAPGPLGPRGPHGPPGEAGKPGEAGTPGEPGENGEPKPGDKGEAGKPGAPGPRGPAGKNGKDGENGTPGAGGPPGEPGQKGQDGNPGTPGEPGQDGTPGERGICPKYCALDGGIFFENGARK